jgi:hypothetical protein
MNYELPSAFRRMDDFGNGSIGDLRDPQTDLPGGCSAASTVAGAVRRDAPATALTIPNSECRILPAA